MRRDRLSLSEARRIALAAQGFDRPRPAGAVDTRHLRNTIRRLGLLQIDYFNVLGPAHYLVPFSRLGPYKTALLDRLVYQRREFTEQWAHEASIVPVESWPLLRYRMENHRARPYGFEAFLDRHPEYVSAVLEAVRERGPLRADDLHCPDGIDRRLAESWFGTVPRAILEALFARGVLAIRERLSNSARTYDLAERVLPAGHHSRVVARADAERELLRLAARAHGIGTAADLADYYRMPVRDARPRLAELVESGDLRHVHVEGWRETAYLHRAAALPRRIEAAAILSPFDPVVWYRPRDARLFEFDYRVEIFVPREKRRWGVYVLPFLLGDRLVARIDLKSDRAAGRLRVPAAFLEPGADPEAVVPPLAAELRTLAAWLGLESVAIAGRDAFSRRLARALRA